MDKNSIIRNYLSDMMNIQNKILKYIEKNENDDIEKLLKYLDDSKFYENKHEFNTFLNFISSLSRNHSRSINFPTNITKIIKFLSEKMMKTFSNYEIFDIFKKDKQTLLFLFKEKIIKPDHFIAWSITNGKYKERFYPHFFYPEFKDLLGEVNIKFQNDFDEFEEKRQKGKNDQYICELIMNDSIIEFIKYVHQTNYPIKTGRIEKSLFETNSFLIDKNPSLIEYAAFFGSIQIFQYLKTNDAILTPSLWLYAIHSNKAEMIYLLEENHVQPSDKTYEECLKESIKCHHNEITNYIQNNLMNHKCLNSFDYFFKFYNYSFCSNDMIDDLFTSYLNKFDNDKILPIYIEKQNIATLYFVFKYIDLYIVDFLINDKKLKLSYNISFNNWIFNKIFLNNIFFTSIK